MPAVSKRGAAPSAKETYFAGDSEARARGLLSILREDGTADEDSLPVGLDATLARKLYRGMLFLRILDERMMALQRQGRIGFYGEARGQEAAVIGSAEALTAGDWIIPALREAGVGLHRGLPLRSYIAQIFGNAGDVSKGRQLPCHPCDRSINYVVMSSCVSTQLPHAVGVAMAMKIAGDGGRCAIGYMGDGGTSEPDFHVAMNFAGVYKPPVVLFCQNNQWAISTPGSVNCVADTIALKGVGYGVEAVRVDGNDVFAVLEATRWATDRARRGEGPSFVEALTYRVSAHSSSDDPSRYRDEAVTEHWKRARDPLARLRTFLAARGWLTPDEDAELARALEAEVRDAIALEEAVPLPDLATIVEDVFETVPWHLAEQLAQHQHRIP